MPIVTAVTPQRDKSRCNIEVDGRFFCGMELSTVLKNRIRAGMEVEEGELSALQLESEKTTALDRALSHLSASMKTEREMCAFLQKKGYTEEVIGYVLEKLRGYGFVDDGAYARAYAESASKKKGARAIGAELRKKGIGEEEVGSALSSIEGEEETAARILEKYMRGKTADKATLRKAYARLIAKGFDHDAARAALSRYMQDED